MNTTPILPPAMLGILGGGQLGRMFAAAAKTMGYGVIVLDPDPLAPAAAFADEHLCAPFNNAAALEKLAQCAAITTEFENVNAEAMCHLARHTRVSPDGKCVATAQNRILEKAAIAAAGLPVAPYQPIHTADDVNPHTVQLLPGILKTATLGYDGKGQYPLDTLFDLQKCLPEATDNAPFVLEKKLDLRAELSVVVCRLDDTHITTFPPAENIHKNGILAYSIVPARLPEDVQQRARTLAQHLAATMNYVGVLAVEIFVVGDSQELIVNEIAPRPHNSGHYTIDACVCDQFQQQVRILCALPPARTDLLRPCCMVNLLGDIWHTDGSEPDWNIILHETDTHLHLYGKKHARIGRKMGHFTVLADTADQAFDKARQLFEHLQNRSV